MHFLGMGNSCAFFRFYRFFFEFLERTLSYMHLLDLDFIIILALANSYDLVH
jgi:hypothetical protein